MVKKVLIKDIPQVKRKNICALNTKVFSDELVRWKKDIIKANNLGIIKFIR